MEENRKPIYPIEPWEITETEFSMDTNYRNETTFALSNGYIGSRGTLEEGYDFTQEEGLEGNFINGFYESEDIRYGEWNYGFPLKSQSLLNVPDAKRTSVWLDGERLDIRAGKISEYRRSLHMKEGYVSREFVCGLSSGKRIRMETERLVSLTDKNVMGIRIKITLLEGCGRLRLRSVLDGDVENHTRKTNPLVDYGPFGRRLSPDSLKAGERGRGAGGYYQGTTKKSGLAMACGFARRLSAAEAEKGWKASVRTGCDGLRAWVEDEVDLREGRSVILEKYIVYTSSADTKPERMESFVGGKLAEACEKGFQALKREQIDYMAGFWKRADVRVEGDDALQQGIRFNLFHIMQAAGRDGITGMGAKGLTGEGYEGHYFWDTEMYALPVFIYTAPELAKKLLDYRYHTLDKARERARVLGHEKGALYPWRTINGEEASTYFPLGTAQYHINADIAYAFWLYVNVTGDMEYLKEKAAEVLCETSRVWADVGCFAECRGGRYCICAVTGPDEYNAIVDNNFYTNLMARENLRSALKALDMIRTGDPAAYERLVSKLDLMEEETVEWEKIAENMYFPYDEKRGVFPLDDGFLMRKPWDESKIPQEKRHLLYENYHPLFIYRQRMSKQADAVLGLYLHSNLFTEEELRRNYDFYQEVTLHHSSLSTCIFGILACRIGYYEQACEYFSRSARMDLDDYHDNFYAGIHAANMAGTWQAMVNGFAGLRVNGGRLEFKPYLPESWKSYSFCILYRGNLLETTVSRGGAKFKLLEGSRVSVWVKDREFILEPGGEAEYEG